MGCSHRRNLDRIAGRGDQLSDKIQDFYGISEDAAEAQIHAFEERNNDHETD